MPHVLKHDYEPIEFTLPKGAGVGDLKKYLPKDAKSKLRKAFGDALNVEELVKAFLPGKGDTLRNTGVKFNISFIPIDSAKEKGILAYISIIYEKDGNKLIRAGLEIEKSEIEKRSNNGITFHLDDVEVYTPQKGLSGFLMRSLRNFWQRNNTLKHIPLSIFAHETGAYTWLKYGFVPDPLWWNDLKEDLKPMVEYYPTSQTLVISRIIKDPSDRKNDKKVPIAECKMDQNVAAVVQRFLKDRRPETLAILADYDMPMKVNTAIEATNLVDKFKLKPETLGKALLFGNVWGGSLDPHNLEQMAKFNRYIDKQVEKARARA